MFSALASPLASAWARSATETDSLGLMVPEAAIPNDSGTSWVTILETWILASDLKSFPSSWRASRKFLGMVLALGF